MFERWVDQYVDNWAKCDTLCNHTIGTFVEMYPEFIEKPGGLGPLSRTMAAARLGCDAHSSRPEG